MAVVDFIITNYACFNLFDWIGTYFLTSFVLQLNRHIVTIDGYKDVPENNEKQLLQAVVAQPVSVGICGSERAFQLYSSVSHTINLKCIRFPFNSSSL